MSYSAKKIAKAFLKRSNPEYGEVITNLKLQKLLYHAQGLYLAMYNKPLFKEKIKAWQYGPVIEEVYYQYEDIKPNVIDIPLNFHEEKELEETDREFLDEVYDVVGQYSTLKLMDMIGNEKPYLETQINEEITTEIMKNYFKSWITEENE